MLFKKFEIMIDFEQKFQQFVSGNSTNPTQADLVTEALKNVNKTLTDDELRYVSGDMNRNTFNNMAENWLYLRDNSTMLDTSFAPNLTNLHADLCANLSSMAANFEYFHMATLLDKNALQLVLEANGSGPPPEWINWNSTQLNHTNWIIGSINQAINHCHAYVKTTVVQNETAPTGQSLDPIIDTVFKLLFTFEQKYHIFMEGHHDTHGQAETVAFKARDLVEGLGTAASSVKTFTGNISNDDLTHLEKSYNDASGDTKTYLNDTDYITLPKFLTQRVCNRVQDSGSKFNDFASAVGSKLNEAVKNATSDTDNLQLTVDRIMGRSDAIIGGLNHAASKCYNLLNTNTTTSAPATTNSTAASTTTMAGNIPGEIIVSVHNTVTGPCSCGRGLTPRTAAANNDNDPADPVTSTWFNPNPMTSAAPDASMVTIRISDTVTVPCVCETATAHHHGHHDEETTTTTRHHSTTVTASPTSTGNAAAVNVDGPSLWLLVAQFVFLICLPSVWAWAVLRRFGF